MLKDTNEFEKLLKCNSGSKIDSFMMIGTTHHRCFQVTNFSDCYIKSGNGTKFILEYMLGLSDPLPAINGMELKDREWYRRQFYYAKNMVNGHHYTFYRLSSPYTDHCRYYPSSRLLKVQECYERMTNGLLMDAVIAPATDERYHGLKGGNMNETLAMKCVNEHWRVDCEETNFETCR